MANPGRIIEVHGDVARADFSGQIRSVSLKFVKAKPGDYFISAGGIVAEVIDEKEAMRLKGCLDGDRK